MTLTLDAIANNPCLLNPPPLPPAEAGFDLEKLITYRTTKHAAVWQSYLDTCTNGTGPLTAALSSAEETENILYIIIPFVSAVVLLVIICLLIYKKNPELWRKLTCRRPRSGPLYDLEQHDKVNYINNKAEKGECWRGNDRADVTLRATRDTDGPSYDKSKINMVKPIHIRTDNGTAAYQSNPKCDIKNANNGMLSNLPYIPDQTSCTDSNLNAHSETIYANHQFQKIMQTNQNGHTNPTFSEDEDRRHKPLPVLDHSPPVDNSTTSDMYIIDDSPYDRVDFTNTKVVQNVLPQIKGSSSKPVPAKRKRNALSSQKAWDNSEEDTVNV